MNRNQHSTDARRLTDAQRDTVAANYWLVSAFLKGRNGNAEPPEEEVAGANLGLMEAVYTYRPELGIPFTAHAFARMRLRVLDELREKNLVRAGRKNLLHQVRIEFNVVVDPRSESRRDPAFDDLAEGLAWLAASWPRSYELLATLYGLDGRETRTTADLAAAACVPTNTVDQARKRALDRLRRHLRESA